MYESPTSSQANAGHLDSASYTVPSQRVLSPTRAGSLPFSQILLRGEGSSLRRNVKGISRSLSEMLPCLDFATDHLTQRSWFQKCHT